MSGINGEQKFDRKNGMKQIKVAAAVIRDGNRIFATQRGYGEFKDWWEFPGGKIEAGETPEQALLREIKEELDADVIIGPLVRTVEWDYPDFHLTMYCYWCSLISPVLRLKEHEAAKWLTGDDIDFVNWLPADEKLVSDIKETIAEI